MRRLPAYLPRAGDFGELNRCFMYADGYGRMDLARAEHAVLAGAARDSAWTVRIAQPGASTVSSCRAGWRRPKDVLLSGVPRAVPPSAWNWSTKQRRVRQVKNSMDRRGFSETGALERPRWPPARVAAKRPLPPALYEGTPAFRTLGRTGMKITIVSMGAMRTSEPAIFQAAFDKGVNYIDTARGYMDGRNEGMVGEALKGYRDRACTWPPR